jgi:hypothetical protein
VKTSQARDLINASNITDRVISSYDDARFLINPSNSSCIERLFDWKSSLYIYKNHAYIIPREVDNGIKRDSKAFRNWISKNVKKMSWKLFSDLYSFVELSETSFKVNDIGRAKHLIHFDVFWLYCEDSRTVVRLNKKLTQEFEIAEETPLFESPEEKKYKKICSLLPKVIQRGIYKAILKNAK